MHERFTDFIQHHISDFPLEVIGGGLCRTEFPMHAHAFTELALITGGEGIHIIDDERYPIAAGDVFVIQGDQAHGFSVPGELQLINISFLPERLFLPDLYLRMLPGYHALFVLEPRYRRRHGFQSRLRLGEEALREIVAFVHALEAEYTARATGYEAMTATMFGQLLVMLSRQYVHAGTRATRSLLNIAEVISVLETNFAERWTLPELAEIARMSANHFLRVFRDATGVSPMEYLLRQRMARAVELLADPAMNITEVASRVGYDDSNYFTRQFKKVTGANPREMRRRLLVT